MRFNNLFQIFVGLLVVTSQFACGHNDNHVAGKEPAVNSGVVPSNGPVDSVDNNSRKSPSGSLEDRVRDLAAKKKATTPKPIENSVTSFSFVTPSGEWSVSEPANGDGTYTKAAFKMASSNAKLAITSIGLPAKGKEAVALVKQCETGFVQNYALHPDLTREWITKGFSISRYADPRTGEIGVWCIINTCKVSLVFAFGAGPNTADNIKIADLTTDEFFEKNPTGGAILK